MNIRTARLPFPARIGNPPEEDAPWSEAGAEFWGAAMVRASRFGYANCLAAMLAASAAQEHMCVLLRQGVHWEGRGRFPEAYTRDFPVPVYPATEPVEWIPYTYTYRMLPLNLSRQHAGHLRECLRAQGDRDGCVIPAMNIMHAPHAPINKAVLRGYQMIDLHDVLRVRTREGVIWEHERAPAEVVFPDAGDVAADRYVIRLVNGELVARTLDMAESICFAFRSFLVDAGPDEIVGVLLRHMPREMDRRWSIILGRRYR